LIISNRNVPRMTKDQRHRYSHESPAHEALSNPALVP
jgi:hypothetical protein